jgi:predicted transcriptional regulator
MRCQYRFKEGDKRVKSGQFKVGDQCTSLRASERSHRFCGGHLKQWNKLNNPEGNKPGIEKAKATSRASRNKIIQANKEIVENSQKELGEQTMGIINILNKNKSIDLAHEYQILKNLKQDPTQEHYAEKYAFALWLNAPEPLRTPKTPEEVCAILGVGTSTLTMWRRSPEIVRIINNDTKQMYLNMYPWLLEKLCEGVARGDKGFTDIAFKHMKEVEVECGSGGKSFNIPDKLKEEAKRINDDGTDNRARGIVDKAKKVANYTALVNGDVKPDGEMVQ